VSPGERRELLDLLGLLERLVLLDLLGQRN
jgi:hypothetical protein